jgi:DNA-binding PadR family transcriptional regulator
MSVRNGLLTLLAQGPSYGYQLKAEFEKRTGDSWPVNVGQVYNTLDRLERDGLVHQTETDDDGHVFYAITAAGTAAARSWLTDPVRRGTAVRDELAIKLALAVTLPDVDAEAIIHTQKVATLHSLQELTRSKIAGGDPDTADEFAWQLVIDSLIFQAEAEVRWLEHSAARIARLRQRGVGIARPFGDLSRQRAKASAAPVDTLDGAR